MENTVPLQPLDLLMTQLGLSNADLVKASTEQLTFKMVHKGRIGRRLTPNAQRKIHNAFKAARPDLKISRRALFGDEPIESQEQSQEPVSEISKPPEKNSEKIKVKKKARLNKQKSLTRKARLSSNKRWRKRQKAKSGR